MTVKILWVVVDAVHEVRLDIELLGTIRLYHVLYIVSKSCSDRVVIADICSICLGRPSTFMYLSICTIGRGA